MRRSTRYVTSSSAVLALLFVEVACWSSPAPTPAEAPAKPSTERPGELAERTLRADAPFDLAFPNQVPPRRDVATNALLSACRAGHHPSCWLLLHVATSESALEVGLADVISQCQKRDLWSCQAIPPLPRILCCPQDFPATWDGPCLGHQGRRATTRQLNFVVSVAMALRTAARCSRSDRRTSRSVGRCTTRCCSRRAADVDASSPTPAHSSIPIGPRRTASRRSTGTVRSGVPSAIALARRCSLLVDSAMRETSTSARVSTGGSQSSVSSSRSSIAMGS